MLNPVRFGIAGGIVWGLAMFISTILAMYIGYAIQFLSIMADIYPGYTISWGGSALGFIYGFFDAFLVLFFTAWLYNKLSSYYPEEEGEL